MTEPRLITQDDDLASVLHVIRSAFCEQNGLIDPPSSMTSLQVTDIFDHLETNVVWVIDRGDEIIACLFGTDKGEALYLSKLSVHPEQRGRRIAAQLMETAEKFAKDSGFKFMEVIVRAELTANHAMFDRFGFSKFAEGSHPGYTRKTEYHFRKAI